MLKLASRQDAFYSTSFYSFFDCTRQSWRPRLQDGFWPALKVLKTQDFAGKDLDCCLKWFFLATNIPLICGFAFSHSAQTLEFKLAHGLMYCNAMIHWIQKGFPSCSVFLHVLVRVDIAPRRVKILSLSICFNMFQHCLFLVALLERAMLRHRADLLERATLSLMAANLDSPEAQDY